MTDLAAAVERGPREHKHALFTPERFRVDCYSLGERAEKLAGEYTELIDSAYERPVIGSSGRGNADGAERDVSQLLASTASIRRALGDACEAISNAHGSLNSAGSALDRVEKAIDKAHPLASDWLAEKRTAERERSATREQLAESRRSHARRLRREADEEDKRAATLERQIKADERKALAAKARAEGLVSKGQAKRNRHGKNGY